MAKAQKNTYDMTRHSILETALHELPEGGEEALVTLAEIPFQGVFVLRALETLNALDEALKDIFGMKLPTKPNSAAQKGDVMIFWLREGQWQIVVPPAQHKIMLQKITAALADKNSSIVDNTDGTTMLRLSGAKGRDVLQKGCPLDLHPQAFAIGSMAQTRLSHAGILLHHSSENQFDIYIRTSFAEYLLRWLYDAGLEYGIHIPKGEAE